MIPACSIVGVSVGDLIVHRAGVSAPMFAVGWIYFVRPMPDRASSRRPKCAAPENRADLVRDRADFLLSIRPVAAVFCLMVFGKLSASVAMDRPSSPSPCCT